MSVAGSAESPMKFQQSLPGRLSKMKLPQHDAMRAVYEAVQNGIDSIEMGSAGGSVVVRVLRDEKDRLVESESGERLGCQAVIGFDVEDDGCGLDTTNFEHFIQSDTMHKRSRGGKGEGRFTWLKVFDEVEVSSVYMNGKARRHRSFKLSAGSEQLEDVREQDTEEAVRTVVRLRFPQKGYDKHLTCDAGEFVSRFVSHFFVKFLVGTRASIRLLDEAENSAVVLNGEFDRLTEKQVKEEAFEVNGLSFTAYQFMLPKGRKDRNACVLCADCRAVEEEPLSKQLADFGEDVVNQSTGEVHVYKVFVTGDYLDSIVSGERNRLHFEKEGDGKSLTGLGVRRSELLARIRSLGEAYLAEHLAEVRREKDRKVRQFVERKAPQFQPFLSGARKYLDDLPVDASERDIEMALYRAKMDGRTEMNEKVRGILENSAPHQAVQSQTAELKSRFMTLANQAQISGLAEAVVARRAVLQVFEAQLGRRADESHHLEKDLHDLFLKRGETSETVPVGPADPDLFRLDNLWVIDERLVFSECVWSDKKVGQPGLAPADARVEPDIMAAGNVWAVAEVPHTRWIALIEFKRPGRKDYNSTNKPDPVEQILRTIVRIRSGDMEDQAGKLRNDWTDLRIYGYAICDLTEPVRQKLRYMPGAWAMKDGLGYFLTSTSENYFIEVLDYKKVLEDAKQRNAAFFKLLGMPDF